MNLPSDPVMWLKVGGAVAAGLGSILLAWRVKNILQWVIYCLVAHEESIAQLAMLADNQPQTGPIIKGVTKHLLDIESKFGLALLVIGFLLLGVGMLCNAASQLLANAL